jgi:hypothetical protein
MEQAAVNADVEAELAALTAERVEHRDVHRIVVVLLNQLHNDTLDSDRYRIAYEQFFGEDAWEAWLHMLRHHRQPDAQDMDTLMQMNWAHGLFSTVQQAIDNPHKMNVCANPGCNNDTTDAPLCPECTLPPPPPPPTQSRTSRDMSISPPRNKGVPKWATAYDESNVFKPQGEVPTWATEHDESNPFRPQGNVPSWAREQNHPSSHRSESDSESHSLDSENYADSDEAQTSQKYNMSQQEKEDMLRILQRELKEYLSSARNITIDTIESQLHQLSFGGAFGDTAISEVIKYMNTDVYHRETYATPEVKKNWAKILWPTSSGGSPRRRAKKKSMPGSFQAQAMQKPTSNLLAQQTKLLDKATSRNLTDQEATELSTLNELIKARNAATTKRTKRHIVLSTTDEDNDPSYKDDAHPPKVQRGITTSSDDSKTKHTQNTLPWVGTAINPPIATVADASSSSNTPTAPPAQNVVEDEDGSPVVGQKCKVCGTCNNPLEYIQAGNMGYLWCKTCRQDTGFTGNCYVPTPITAPLHVPPVARTSEHSDSDESDLDTDWKLKPRTAEQAKQIEDNKETLDEFISSGIKRGLKIKQPAPQTPPPSAMQIEKDERNQKIMEERNLFSVERIEEEMQNINVKEFFFEIVEDTQKEVSEYPYNKIDMYDEYRQNIITGKPFKKIYMTGPFHDDEQQDALAEIFIDWFGDDRSIWPLRDTVLVSEAYRVIVQRVKKITEDDAYAAYMKNGPGGFGWIPRK